MSDRSIEFATTRDLWEFVLSFEDGSLPADAWNEQTVATVAVWYLSMLPVEEAATRLESAILRNRRRFRRRTDKSDQSGPDLSRLWPRMLQLVLNVASQRDPLPLANRLMRERGTVLASRVA